MRKQSYLLKESVFRELTPVAGTFNYDYIKPHVLTAQDMHVQSVLGSPLYWRLNAGIADDDLNSNEEILLDDYIAKCLTYYALNDAISFLVVKMENSGIVTKSVGDSTSITLEDAEKLRLKIQDTAEFYKQRLIVYLQANKSLYPEIETIDDLQPSTNNYDFGYNFDEDYRVAASRTTPPSPITGIHNDLTERDAADAHPIEAITGLATFLADLQTDIDNVQKVELASQSEAESNTENTKYLSSLRTFQQWFNNSTVYDWGSSLLTNTKTIIGAINELWNKIINLSPAVGGYANNLYFSNIDSASPIESPTIKILTYTPDASETVLSLAVTSAEGDKLLRSFLYPNAVATNSIPSGLWSFNLFASVSSTTGVSQIGARYFKYSTVGVKTYLFPSILWSAEINNVNAAYIPFSYTYPLFTVDPTDRMGCDIFIRTTGSGTRTFYLTIGDGYASYLNNPNAIRHSQLRALDAANSHPTTAIGLSTPLLGQTNQDGLNVQFDAVKGTKRTLHLTAWNTASTTFTLDWLKRYDFGTTQCVTSVTWSFTAPTDSEDYEYWFKLAIGTGGTSHTFTGCTFAPNNDTLSVGNVYEFSIKRGVVYIRKDG